MSKERLQEKLNEYKRAGSRLGEINSPRFVIREAFANGLIDNGEFWIDMMIDRNKTSHLYDEEEARPIC
ncbi:nucleotidyltransferase substrate binding protein [Lentibacillus sp. N15]|uniref:nucleotidyltransferase substrate binding protein n=1 Tax=Lentibacillus songyuanensis TaxID=3136161 RepID=UPI0031B9F282